MKYQYRVTIPIEGYDYIEIEIWLNNMAKEGWEFVGEAQYWWINHRIPQSYWIFKKEIPKKKKRTESSLEGKGDLR